MYIIFRPASLKEIENLIDKTRNENIYPFKIDVVLGFIVEDTKNVEYSKTYQDIGHDRSIPSTIHSKEAFASFYQYLLSYISEEMELTHEGSANRLIGIHSIVFQITHLRPGKRNNFEINDILIGVASEVPIYFKNNKNTISGFSKLSSNCCITLVVIQAKHLFDIEKKKVSQNMLRREIDDLFKERHIDLSEFKGEQINALQWYAYRFNINLNVQKVVNLN